MKTPGFNAEASLYETSGRYQAAMCGIAPTTRIVAQQIGCPDPMTCTYAAELCLWGNSRIWCPVASRCRRLHCPFG
jgi:hypothetical protein